MESQIVDTFQIQKMYTVSTNQVMYLCYFIKKKVYSISISMCFFLHVPTTVSILNKKKVYQHIVIPSLLKISSGVVLTKFRFLSPYSVAKEIIANSSFIPSINPFPVLIENYTEKYVLSNKEAIY